MRLMTIHYKVAAREEDPTTGHPAIPERRDEAIVTEVGCGFAYHLSIVMWGGELICTKSATAGHAYENIISKIEARKGFGR